MEQGGKHVVTTYIPVLNITIIIFSEFVLSGFIQTMEKQEIVKKKRKLPANLQTQTESGNMCSRYFLFI